MAKLSDQPFLPIEARVRRIGKITGTGKKTVALTRDFRETIRERAQREPRFRMALLREAIALILSGNKKTGGAILRFDPISHSKNLSATVLKERR
jgi:ABC-type hemin transport system substrate-binding protein